MSPVPFRSLRNRGQERIAPSLIVRLVVTISPKCVNARECGAHILGSIFGTQIVPDDLARRYSHTPIYTVEQETR